MARTTKTAHTKTCTRHYDWSIHKSPVHYFKLCVIRRWSRSRQLSLSLYPAKLPTSALRYDARTITLRGQQITLSCIGKRVQVWLHVPEYFKKVFETWTFKGATLTYTRHKKQFWVRLVFVADDPPSQESGNVLGIDRGLYHLAVTSEKQFFSSSQIRATQRRYLYNCKQLQQKGTRNAKRHLKKMSGREQRFMRDINHCVSKKLAGIEGVSVYALEDLTGIRNSRRRKKMNKWVSSWPFYQLEQFLSYKAGAKGKRIGLVDPRYTSQKCSRCKQRHSVHRKKSRFKCATCGYRTHADLNAAQNIRDDYLINLSSTPCETEEQGAVNHPIATDSNVQLQAPSLYGWGG